MKTEMIKEMENAISNAVKFKTSIEDNGIFIHEKSAFAVCVNSDPDSVQITGTADVEWIIEPEYKTDRIKSMNAFVMKVSFEFEYSDDDGQEGTLSFSTAEKGWTVADDLVFDDRGYLMPSEIHVDFDKKTVHVS